MQQDELLEPQLAHCYACSGNTAEAVHRFTALLDGVEPFTDEALKDQVINIDELVGAVTDIFADAELRRRAYNLARRLGLEKCYPRLISQEPAE